MRVAETPVYLIPHKVFRLREIASQNVDNPNAFLMVLGPSGRKELRIHN